MARPLGRLIEWSPVHHIGPEGHLVSRTDIIVLGAGIVGVCAALQLQRRGFDVTLVDRHTGPGRETSYGNAGLIQPDGFSPILFPRDLTTLAGYASNKRRDCVYHPSALWSLAPALLKYWKQSGRLAAGKTLAANLPLFARSVADHMDIAREAGIQQRFRPTGWTRVFRVHDSFDTYCRKILDLEKHGVSAHVLSPPELGEIEPDLTVEAVGAVRLMDQLSLSNPQALTEAYLDLFLKNGGQFTVGDAQSLDMRAPRHFVVSVEQGRLEGKRVVICLGPWSGDVLAGFGLRAPHFVKRGYHVHFSTKEGAKLRLPTSDADGGYSITPMDDGVRLNTGVEIARRDAPISHIQLSRIIPIAREFFPLGDQLDAVPWVGSRPCLPDMLPVIGESPRHEGLWFSFGHAHHGLTLSASSGLLLAEMMSGATPFTDPTPYSLTRFL